MRDKKRRNASRIRAEQYAPRPQSSSFMYGLVGVVLALLAIVVFARFYDIAPFAHPAWIGAALLGVFGGAIVLRIVRSRRHAKAHRREYDVERR